MFLTHSGVCAVVWFWAIHSLPGERGNRVLMMSCLPGPTGVTSSSVRDEIKAPTLLVFGWVGVFVGSRGELMRSGVFLYSSVEPSTPLRPNA